MKKLLIILTAILLFAGCSKDSPKKYTFVYEAETIENMHVYLDEYDDNDRRVGINEIIRPNTGFKKDFKSSAYAQYVVVRIVLESENFSLTRYVANIFYLTNKKTTILLEDDTRIQSDMP